MPDDFTNEPNARDVRPHKGTNRASIRGTSIIGTSTTGTMEKPAEILDREHQWSTLTDLWESRRPQLAFAIGRRRIGKSFLLSRFARAVDGVYYQATKRAEKEQLAGISRVLGAHFQDAGLEAGLEFPTWEAVFDFVTTHSEGRSLLIVLDEFPYLVESDPALPSVIQKYWDHTWSNTGIKLVLSGSYVSSMKRLEAADQPLYGRRTAKLLVEPFTYREAGLFTPDYSARDRLIAYGIFGHLPGNLALLDEEMSLESNVARVLLNPSGRLADDAQTLLDAFLGDSAVYYAILEAVANGNHTWKSMTSRVGRSGGSLSRPLLWLEEMGLIERVTPITEKYPAKSKRSKYRLADPYLQFWHRIVSPLISAGMLGMVDPGRLWQEHVARRLNDYMGTIFESACRDFVRRGEKIPLTPIRVGEWWDNTSTQQVDIVAIGAQDDLFIGECKWGAIAREDLGTLRKRAADVVTKLGIQPTAVHLAFFSGSGSADPYIENMVRRGDVLFFDASDLY